MNERGKTIAEQAAALYIRMIAYEIEDNVTGDLAAARAYVPAALEALEHVNAGAPEAIVSTPEGDKPAGDILEEWGLEGYSETL